MNKELILATTIFVLLFSLLVGVCMFTADALGSLSCAQVASMNQKYEFRYNWIVMDCFMKTSDGLWIPASQVYAKEDLSRP